MAGTKKSSREIEWEKECLSSVDIALEADDNFTRCICSAIPEKQLRPLVEAAWIDWLKCEMEENGFKKFTSYDKYLAASEKHKGSGDYFCIHHAEWLIPDVVLPLAKTFSVAQNRKFLRVFSKVEWTLADWNFQEREGQEGAGVNELIQCLSLSAARKVLDHFVSLGLPVGFSHHVLNDLEQQEKLAAKEEAKKSA